MENKRFEEYLLELENIVKSLENKNTSLEEAVANYTKGLELSKKCYEILSQNEELVVKKMTDAGLVDFNKE
jgi:exodeoxyribonuclease VII small subunit